MGHDVPMFSWGILVCFMPTSPAASSAALNWIWEGERTLAGFLQWCARSVARE